MRLRTTLPRPLLALLLSAAVASTALADRLPPGSDPAIPRTGGSDPTRNTPGEDAALSPPKPRAPAVDAPVDGVDGKPHAGPFVESSPERRPANPKDLSDATDKPLTTKEESSDYIGQDETIDSGVMGDPYRPGPKEGTRGTEGGISGKSKTGQDNVEKIPDSPKDPPPLPPNEQQNIPPGDSGGRGDYGGGGSSSSSSSSSSKSSEKEREKSEDGGKKDEVLQKPDGLPELPRPASFSTSADVEDPSPAGDSKTPSTENLIASHTESTAGNELIQPLHSFVLSLSMIVFSEIGDKTFLVAALMAMRHPRMVVFSSAFSALITMTVLSAVLGHAVPTLFPASYTNLLASFLFLVFGGKMLLEAKAMAPDETASEEMKEVEMELEEKEHQQQRVGRRRSSANLYALEAGRGRASTKSRTSNNRLPSPVTDSSASSSRESSPSRGVSVSKILTGFSNLFSFLLSPAWVQTFIMTFLGEWGDRSQIATIAMAAGQDYWWVTGGAIIGHAFCTAAAVLGGRAIAGKVSMRVVTFGGAIAFFVFGLIYLFEAVY